MQGSVKDSLAAFIQQEDLPETLLNLLGWFYQPLADYIAKLHKLDNPVLLGVNGAQGSGKSTTSEILCLVLQEQYGINCASLSLDDLYLTKKERQQLAQNIHPLFITRGVPGTHDLKLGNWILDQVQEGLPVVLPRFDKMSDDRFSEEKWKHFQKLDVLIIEGWCVGCKPQDDVRTAINILEIDEDEDCVWRKRVNSCLQTDYADFFARLDALVMLAVPSMEKIYEWRELQEQKMEQKQGNRGMSRDEVQRFIMHYERLTRWMLQEMPKRADVLVPIGDDHAPEKIIIVNS